MGVRAHRRIVPLEILPVGDVGDPVADYEEGERGRKKYPRRSVDVRYAVYVSFYAFSVLSTTVRSLSLSSFSKKKKNYVFFFSMREESKFFWRLGRVCLRKRFFRTLPTLHDSTLVMRYFSCNYSKSFEQPTFRLVLYWKSAKKF